MATPEVEREMRIQIQGSAARYANALSRIKYRCASIEKARQISHNALLGIPDDDEEFILPILHILQRLENKSTTKLDWDGWDELKEAIVALRERYYGGAMPEGVVP